MAGGRREIKWRGKREEKCLKHGVICGGAVRIMVLPV